MSEHELEELMEASGDSADNEDCLTACGSVHTGIRSGKPHLMWSLECLICFDLMEKLYLPPPFVLYLGETVDKVFQEIMCKHIYRTPGTIFVPRVC